MLNESAVHCLHMSSKKFGSSISYLTTGTGAGLEPGVVLEATAIRTRVKMRMMKKEMMMRTRLQTHATVSYLDAGWHPIKAAFHCL